MPPQPQEDEMYEDPESDLLASPRSSSLSSSRHTPSMQGLLIGLEPNPRSMRSDDSARLDANGGHSSDGISSGNSSSSSGSSSSARRFLEPLRAWCARSYGVLLMALAAFVFSIMAVLVKSLVGVLPALELLALRAAVMWVLAVTYLAAHGIPIFGPRGKRRLVVVRGIVGVISMSCFYVSMQVLPIADASVIFFTAPIFTGPLALLMLGEPWGWLERAMGLLALTGATLVARPSFLFGAHAAETPGGRAATQIEAASHLGVLNSLPRGFAIATGLLGAVLSALTYVLIRRLGRGVHALVNVQILSLVAMLLLPIAVFTLEHPVWPPTTYDWLLTAGVGVSGFLGQMLINFGTQRISASRASLVQSLEVVFAFVWQVALFSLVPSVLSIIGALLVVGASVGIGMFRAAKKQAPNSNGGDDADDDDGEEEDYDDVQAHRPPPRSVQSFTVLPPVEMDDFDAELSDGF